MKIRKTTMIIGVLLIAAVIMYFVYFKGKGKVGIDASTNADTMSLRVKKIVDKIPYVTREKIVGLYSWYVANGDTIILKDGKVFNTTKNKFDDYGRTSIERYRLDGVLWDVRANYQLIDASTESWLKANKFTLSEFQESLSILN